MNNLIFDENQIRQLVAILAPVFEQVSAREHLLGMAFPPELNRSARISTMGTTMEFTRRLVEHYNTIPSDLRAILEIAQSEYNLSTGEPLKPFVDRVNQVIARPITNKLRIFISYRRKSGWFMHAVVKELREKLDAEIFVDFQGISSSDYKQSILKHLKEADCFLLLLTEGTLDCRIFRPDDWVRREVCEALKLGKPLLQISNGVPFAAPKNIPQDIEELAQRQGYKLDLELWTQSIQNIIEKIPQAVASPPEAVNPKPIRDLWQRIQYYRCRFPYIFLLIAIIAVVVLSVLSYNENRTPKSLSAPSRVSFEGGGFTANVIIFNVTADSNGAWFATSQGLGYQKLSNLTLVQISSVNETLEHVTTIDGAKRVYFSKGNRLGWYEIETGNHYWVTLTINNEPLEKQIRGLSLAAPESLAISIQDSGILLCNPLEDRDFARCEHLPPNYNGVPAVLSKLAITSAGVPLGTGGAAIFRWQPSSKEWVALNALPSSTDLAVDTAGNLWVTTLNGLSVLPATDFEDSNEQNWINCTPSDNPLLEEQLYTLAISKLENSDKLLVWLISKSGIVGINTSTQLFDICSEREGSYEWNAEGKGIWQGEVLGKLEVVTFATQNQVRLWVVRLGQPFDLSLDIFPVVRFTIQLED